MRLSSVFISVLTLLVFVNFAAALNVKPILSNYDKKIGMQAFAQAKAKKWKSAIATIDKANNPALKNLLMLNNYTNARFKQKDINLAKIKNFVARNKDYPFIKTIKNKFGLIAKDTTLKPKSKPQSIQPRWNKIAVQTRDLLKEQKYNQAFNKVRGAYQHYTNRGTKASAYWLEGWIALRFVDKPEHAAKMFKLLYDNTGRPISRSRGSYWLARSYEQLGKLQEAANWYAVASQYNKTFYGQLAKQRLKEPGLQLTAHDIDYTSQQATNFLTHKHIYNARILAEVGQTRLARIFLNRYLSTNDTAEDYRLVADLGTAMGKPNWGVLAGKKASYNDLSLIDANYPIEQFTAKISPEKALALAIMRQESEFDQTITSHAGARGIMQVMPKTAQYIAKQGGWQYNKNKLFDKQYNITFGSYYLNERINNFNGSYILAVAAYNAGKHRVDKWLETYGDPRGKPLYQVLDWIELIPFNETRNYVHRVLENTQVYRARLNNNTHKIQLVEDLAR